MQQLELLLRISHTIKTGSSFAYEIWSETLYMDLFDGLWYVGHSSLPGFSSRTYLLNFQVFGTLFWSGTWSKTNNDIVVLRKKWQKKSVWKSKQRVYFWFLGVSKTPLSIHRLIRRRHLPRAIPWLRINAHAAVRASSDDSVYCKKCPKFGFHSLNRVLITCPSEYQDLPYLYKTWSEGNISPNNFVVAV